MKLPIIAALAAFTVAGVAHASSPPPKVTGSSYTFNGGKALKTKTNYGSSTLTVTGGKTITDEFTFTVGSSVIDSIAGSITQGKGYDISSETLALYTSAGQYITSKTFTPTSTSAPTLMADLVAGTYDIYATISVAAGYKGSFTVTDSIKAAPMSAAPEPATWLLMFAGLGLVGGAMRYNRRNKGAMAVAA